jgi:enoyl-CoA hydratase/carnithine racemase
MIDLDFQNGVATCVLNAPPANTINPVWCARFHDVINQLEDRQDWRILHIKSSLKLFCAGADLKHVAEGFSSPNGVTDFIASLQSYRELFDRIENLSGVTFAEIGGAALGGGLELALACDLRLVADDALIGLPEVGLGLLPAIGGTQRLTAICGSATANRLILTGETIKGIDAVGLGLAQWSASTPDVELQARAIVERVARMPSLALQHAKSCIRGAGSTSGYGSELQGSRELFVSAETQEHVKSFLSRRRKW